MVAGDDLRERLGLQSEAFEGSVGPHLVRVDKESAMIRPKPGDHVLHRPSGETWVVAVAVPDRNQLIACGWPLSIERLSDCEVLSECSIKESRELAMELAKPSMGTDLRRTWVQQFYPELFQESP